MEVFKQILNPNGTMTIGNYTFEYRTDNNEGKPTFHKIGDSGGLLFYHDRYVDGATKYGRSYRAILFQNGERLMSELRLMDEFIIFARSRFQSQIWMTNLLESVVEIEHGLLENATIEKFCNVNHDGLQDWWELWDGGNIPEHWHGLLFVQNPGHKRIGELYTLHCDDEIRVEQGGII